MKIYSGNYPIAHTHTHIFLGRHFGKLLGFFVKLFTVHYSMCLKANDMPTHFGPWKIGHMEERERKKAGKETWHIQLNKNRFQVMIVPR